MIAVMLAAAALAAAPTAERKTILRCVGYTSAGDNAAHSVVMASKTAMFDSESYLVSSGEVSYSLSGPMSITIVMLQAPLEIEINRLTGGYVIFARSGKNQFTQTEAGICAKAAAKF